MSGDLQLVNYQKYSSHYNEISKQMVNQPVKQRRSTNIGCTVFFVLFILLFFILGIIYIVRWNSNPPPDPVIGENNQKGAFQGLYGYMISGILFSVFLSYLYVFLLKVCTKVMVYTMIGLTGALILSICIVGLATQIYALAVIMGIVLLVYIIILCCFRQQIKTGIILVKIATKFLSDKLKIFLIPLLKLIFTFSFGIFFIISLGATFSVANSDQGQNDSLAPFAIGIYFICWLLLTFVFYYMMTYIISFVCSNWYYGTNQTSLISAYKMMFKQFGSLVFAAVVIVGVIITRMIVDSSRGRAGNNPVCMACLCLISCYLKFIENLLKVLNHYTVILIALTGQDYISGAKSTIGLLWQQLPLLYVTNFICNLLVFCGLIFTICLPILLVYGVMRLGLKNETDPVKVENDITIVVSIVAISSLLISSIVFEIIVESTSCIFIYYAIDKDFCSRGLIIAKRMPQDAIYCIESSAIMEGDKNDGNYQKLQQ